MQTNEEPPILVRRAEMEDSRRVPQLFERISELAPIQGINMGRA